MSDGLDLLAGGRYFDVRYELLEAGSQQAESSEGWIDPLVAARLELPLSSRWSLKLASHLGGFGLGSDLIWGAEGAVLYNLLENLAVGLGYRVWAVDYSSGSGETLFAYDLTHTGPGIGVIFRSN
ncbi:MAG: hypothetical protein JSV86_09020 [Gemmatimonadota bacterium]|nr:MAG: hypothetical protein JSV86_09020 [Gemmatimonadota bacterium]